MKKVLDILEKNVHWFAIALGLLWLLYMGYSYFIVSPVQVEVAGEKLGPGDIEQYIFEHPVQALSAQLTDRREPPSITMPKWLEEFRTSMDFSARKPVTLASKPWVVTSPPPMKLDASDPNDGGGAQVAQIVEALPEVPPALMGGVLAMSSTVAVPGQGAGKSEDKNIAAVGFTLSNVNLTNAFKAVKLPQALYPTCIIEVKLFRQEQKSNGEWGPETLIKRLPFDVTKSPPADSAPDGEKTSFLEWAKVNQRPIVQPLFYDVAAGDAFVNPPPTPPAVVEAPAPVASQGLPDFDPTRTDYTIEEIRQMTLEQKTAWQKAKKAKDDAERAARKGRAGGGRTGGKGGGKGGAGPGGMAPDDPDRPVALPQSDNVSASGTVLFRQTPPARDERDEDANRNTPPQPQPGQPQPGQPGAAVDAEPTTQSSAPDGLFDPSANPDWTGWAFDESVEPGKTYRYRIQYSIKNPLFDKAKWSKDPSWPKCLALASDLAKTEWTPATKVPSRTSFYIARSPMQEAGAVEFQVFAYQAGAKRQKNFTVLPGDMIGSLADGVDFATGSTLIDIVADPRNPGHAYILVADASGAISKRDFASDKANPELQNDLRSVAVGAAPPAAVAGGGAAGQ